MSGNMIETVMGGVVLVVAGSFLYFAYNGSNIKTVEGYAVQASFTNITGVGVGSDVRIGGIKVGVIESLDLDPVTYNAVAHMRVANTIKLPKDSSAAVQSAGLLGEKFVALEPGGDNQNLKDGDSIAFTQASVSLEEMIGKFVFSGGGVGDGEKKPDEPAGAAPELSLP
jgi:phospholipid/cholesterol/gamma-HCH transport system substrate-binding protein